MEASAIEPRLSLSYLLNENSRLSLGYGLHAQTQPIYTYFVQTPTANGVLQTNQDLGMTKSKPHCVRLRQQLCTQLEV